VTQLVIGANGFLGSHVTRQLVESGADVRAMTRAGSNARGIDDLPLERLYGDIFDTEALTRAMHGRDVVYYCVVDTRAYLRDPAPLYRTNVEGLRNVLEVAKSADLKRFVFTSTIGTIGRTRGRPATEDDAFNWHRLGGHYVRSRVAAEDMVMRYAAEFGLPAVAMCVSNTFGGADWGPSLHGAGIIGATVAGKMPFLIRGVRAESVGIADAARALVLAAENGRNGERYIVSERMMATDEIVRIAADEAGVPAPRLSVPLPVVYVFGGLGSMKALITRSDAHITIQSTILMHVMSQMDHGKATRELGWHPRPVEEEIRAAARFWMAKGEETRAR
jgi:dihydroflavonol-4-reductase